MWDEATVNEKLNKLMLGAFTKVRKRAKERHLTNRTAALSIGVEKVANEKAKRGLFP